MESFLRNWGVANYLKLRWQAEGKAMRLIPIGIYPKGGVSREIHVFRRTVDS